MGTDNIVGYYYREQTIDEYVFKCNFSEPHACIEKDNF